MFRFKPSLPKPSITWLPTLFLVAIYIVLAFSNISLKDWFIGWDNTLVELNFWLNFKRAFVSVWQENQGLGHIGGHGYGATLPHTIFLWLLSLIIPINALRPSFLLLLLFCGSFGAFELGKYLLKEKNLTASLASTSGALFYLLNLSTVQQAFTPLEPFLIFHALLPWVLLSVFKYYKKPTKTSLLSFILLSLPMTGIGFLPPLFVVYGICLGLISLSFIGFRPNWKKIKQVTAILFITLAVNSYWLLPVAYFTVESADVYLGSLNNQVSTTGFNLQSISDGSLENVVQLKGFVYWAFNATPGAKGNPEYVMQVWHNHVETIYFSLAMAILFTIALFGMFFFSKRDWQKTSISFIFIFGFTSLAQRVPGLELVSQLFKIIPVINQSFRAAFTKVSAPLTLSYALLICFGVYWLLKQFKRRKLLSFGKIPLGIISILLTLYIGLPAFKGELLSSSLRLEFPEKYNQTILFFNKQPDKKARILHLPMADHFGWHTYDWGYTGSGFWWYGIEQPFIDRTFDAWSNYNETAYLQILDSLYQDDLQTFNTLLRKYNINWIVIDQSLINPTKNTTQIQLDRLLPKLNKDSDLKLTRTFDDLYIFQTNIETQNNLNLISNTTVINKQEDFLVFDPATKNHQNYVESDNENNITNWYPFSFITSQRKLKNVKWNNNEITISGNQLPAAEYTLKLPKIENAIKAKVFAQLVDSTILINFEYQTPVIQIDNFNFSNTLSENVSFDIDQEKLYYLSVNDEIFIFSPNALTENTLLGNVEINPNAENNISLLLEDELEIKSYTADFQKASVIECWKKLNEENTLTVKNNISQGFSLTALNSSACISAIINDQITQENETFLITFDHRSETNSKPSVCITRQEDQVQQCYNGTLTKALTPSTTFKTVSQIFSTKDLGTYWIDIKINEDEIANQTQKVDITNLTLTKLNKIAETKIAFKDNQERYHHFKTTTENKIFATEKDFSFQKINFSTYSKATNCDSEKRGKVLSNINIDSIEFQSENGGINCFNINFSSNTLNDQLVKLAGSSNKGKGFDFNVFNPSTKLNDAESYIGDKNFEELFSLISQPSLSESNRQFSLNTFSFPGVESNNILEDFELTTFPIRWLSNIEIKRKPENEISKQLPLSNQKNLGNYLYTVKIESQKNNQIISLNQGFDKGWIAINKNGFKLLQHVKYNGWANGWVIDNQEQDLIILYWPQLLVFAGYGIGCVVIFSLLIIFTKTSPPPHKDPAS